MSRIETVASNDARINRINRNIVLIGMPGCGKTSIGIALAKMTEREFADTDEWIIKTAGKSIAAIFAEDGEDVFRMMEQDALQIFCRRRGLVIATGGGVVKRSENLCIIRQNGIIIFLDRDIDLLATSGRPLSEQEGVHALASARLPLYREWSEYTVPVRGVRETAADICGLLFGGLL